MEKWKTFLGVALGITTWNVVPDGAPKMVLVGIVLVSLVWAHLLRRRRNPDTSGKSS